MRLTPKQKDFLQSIREQQDWWVECFMSELRTAQSLSKRGLVELEYYEGVDIRNQEFFECRLTEEGWLYLQQPTKTVPFTKSDVTAYLDSCVNHWRSLRDATDDSQQKHDAVIYIDAFQSVRISLTGKLCP